MCGTQVFIGSSCAAKGYEPTCGCEPWMTQAGGYCTGACQTPHTVHSHTVHLPLGAPLSPCAMCGAGACYYNLPGCMDPAADNYVDNGQTIECTPEMHDNFFCEKCEPQPDPPPHTGHTTRAPGTFPC